MARAFSVLTEFEHSCCYVNQYGRHFIFMLVLRQAYSISYPISLLSTADSKVQYNLLLHTKSNFAKNLDRTVMPKVIMPNLTSIAFHSSIKQ